MSQNPSQTRNIKRRGPPRPTTARSERGGLVLSAVLHAGLIAGALLTFNRVIAPPEETHAVPVDLVTIARQTNVAPEAPPPPKVVVPTPTMEAPALPQFAEPEPAPDATMPKFQVKPDKSEEEQKKPTSRDFAALLNQLTAQPKTPKNAKASTRIVQGVGAANLRTADLVDALQSQIAQCWSPPVGAPHASDLVVDFDVRLNRNGSVASLELLPGSVAAASGNPYTRAAAEAASRAIYQCQPYKLPPDRYGEWSEIDPFHFDPRQMMGQ